MAGAHLDVSIQDAIRNNADGALVCYTQLPAKYGDGFCEGVEVASKSAKDAIQSHANVLQMSWRGLLDQGIMSITAISYAIM